MCEDGILTRRSITTGVTSGECAEITEGLEEGEQVITDPGSHEEGDSILLKEREDGGVSEEQAAPAGE